MDIVLLQWDNLGGTCMWSAVRIHWHGIFIIQLVHPGYWEGGFPGQDNTMFDTLEINIEPGVISMMSGCKPFMI